MAWTIFRKEREIERERTYARACVCVRAYHCRNKLKVSFFSHIILLICIYIWHLGIILNANWSMESYQWLNFCDHKITKDLDSYFPVRVSGLLQTHLKQYDHKIEPRHDQTCLLPYANNKAADSLAHPRSLISAFVVRCLDSIISLLVIAEISRL